MRRGEGTGAVGAGASKRVGAACPRQAGQYTYSLECIWRRRPNPATATRTLRKTKAEAFATRSAILDAAEHLFQARGVSGTSLQDIAAAAGVTRGAVYWHFKDKGDLFNAMMARVCLPMETAALAASDTSPPLDALRAHLRGILERVAADAQVRRVFQIFTQKVEYVDEMATVRERHLQMRRDHLAVLARLLGEAAERPEGAQVKVNLLLRRLPAVREGLPPEVAFGGTFHVHESFSGLERAHATAAAGAVPEPLPGEIYCHSLADRSILGPELAGMQTLTVFGLHVPDSLVDRFGNVALRDRLRRAVFSSLDGVLAESVEPLLATDGNGEPCVEVKTTRDLEEALGMPGGHIFHGPLAWPWAGPDEALDTPARRWGVATAHDRVLLCGSGARRGGGVSGIAGHNAAMAALDLLGVGGGT